MEQFIYTVGELTLEMFIFSVLGWCTEVTLKYIQFHRFINRGFLIGPYCPIYGSGVVAVSVLVGGLIGYDGTYVETFFAGFVICGALEYFVSWYMEKMFHARWWDYSKKPMNLNGRIWIGNLILFGLASVAIIKWINPSLYALMSHIPEKMMVVLTILIFTILLADNIVSHILMNVVKKSIDNAKGDNTEEISTQIHALLRNHKALLRRISQAYPNLQARPKAFTDELKRARKEVKKATKKARAEIKAKASKAKTEITEKTDRAKTELAAKAGQAKTELTERAGQAKTELTERAGQAKTESEAQLEQARAKLKAIEAKFARR